MNRKLSYLIVSLLVSIPVGAQVQQHTCSSAKLKQAIINAAKGTIADTAELHYDVHYVKLDLNLTDRDNRLSGSATTHAITTTNMSQYVFELSAVLQIDSLKFNNIILPVSTSGDVCKVTLPAVLPANTSFEVTTYYKGSPTEAFINNQEDSTTPWVTFTYSQPFFAKGWWPCKQDLRDKIDSTAVWLTVDSPIIASSNGILEKITLNGASKRYEWKSRYPIDYYLISVVAARYEEYNYYMHFNNSVDSMLVLNHLYPNTLLRHKPILDSTALMIQYFSDIFGRYPFWKEKYGQCTVPVGGGLENQTLSILGYYPSDLVAHELGHQWMGNYVTCSSWSDIWINEGWASYMEYLMQAHFYGRTGAEQKMAQIHRDAQYPTSANIKNPNGVIYVQDSTDIGKIFSYQNSYAKGAAVAHMLRFEINNDSLFFNTVQSFLQQYGGATATIDQFKNAVERKVNKNLDTFFNQWIYNSGWPVFNAHWNQVGNQVWVRLNQVGAGNVRVFNTPLELQLKGPQGDTTIRINIKDSAKTFVFLWNRPMHDLIIDPNNWVLDDTGVVQRDPVLSVGANTMKNNYILFPNPVQQQLQVTHFKPGILSITDITGRQLLSATFEGAAGTKVIDMRSIPQGIYLYRISEADGTPVTQGKLIKE